MTEYIEREKVKEVIKDYGKGAIEDGQQTLDPVDDILLLHGAIDMIPTADVVEVVRCKDCIYFQPDFVLSNDGERRPYTQEEKESGFGYVSIDKGINCGSRCERHGYWEENKIPVWFNENDFCSYGKRKDGSE